MSNNVQFKHFIINHLVCLATCCFRPSIAEMYSFTDEFVCDSCSCICEFDKCDCA